jgi:uncharacterized protein YbjT (DUF2867 family)
LRPTVFQQNPLFWKWAAESIESTGSLRLPFGAGRTSPVAAADVAEVAAAILRDPSRAGGRVLELTGPRSMDMKCLADEYASALGRSVRFDDLTLDEWRDRVLLPSGLPDHVYAHILTMAKLHAAGRYDRLTQTVESVLHRPATSLRETIGDASEQFNRRPSIEKRVAS